MWLGRGSYRSGDYSARLESWLPCSIRGMLEITIQAIGIDAEAANTEAGEAPSVHLQVVGGTDLPFAQPGTQRPLRVPTTAVRFDLTKEAATQLGDLLKAEADKLPDTPTASGKLAIASSMAEVEGLGKQLALDNGAK